MVILFVQYALTIDLRMTRCACVCVGRCVWVGVCVCTHMLCCVWLFVTPWTVAHQAPLSTEFSKQQYWNVLPLFVKML